MLRALLVGWAALVIMPARADASPATPALVAGPRTFVAFAGQSAHVRVAWMPVSGAARYRATWTDGAGEKVDSIELPGATTVYERPEASPGHYEIQVVAIDEAAAESAPVTGPLDVILVNGVAPGGDPKGDASTSAFAVGSRFSSPGLECRFGDGDADSEVHATKPGKTVLRCARADSDEQTVEVPIVIAPVVVATRSPAIPRGEDTRVHLTVASVAPIGETLEVTGPDDVELGEVERTPLGLDIRVRPRGPADRIALAVKTDGVTLGEAELAVVAPTPRPEPAVVPAWFALEVGGIVGVFAPPTQGADASFLGHPKQPGDTLTGGPTFGGRLGIFPVRRIGLETEVALALPGYTDRMGLSAVGIARAQLAGRVVEDDRFGLRLLAGADLLGVLVERGTSHHSASGAVHYGAAFTIETRRDLWLRLEALHLITTAQDAGYAHCFELQIGLVTRFGRRDRWW